MIALEVAYEAAAEAADEIAKEQAHEAVDEAAREVAEDAAKDAYDGVVKEAEEAAKEALPASRARRHGEPQSGRPASPRASNAEDFSRNLIQARSETAMPTLCPPRSVSSAPT